MIPVVPWWEKDFVPQPMPTAAVEVGAVCVHLGSKRRCCDALWICRQQLGTDCVLSGAAPEGVRACDKCEYYQPRTNSDGIA